MAPSNQVDVAIIIPVYNAANWLEETLESVYKQTFAGSLEISVFSDASSDSSMSILKSWQQRFDERSIKVVMSESDEKQPRGVGFARNQAIKQSTGKFLCLLDADDIMAPERIELQHAVALQNPDALIGSRFTRTPVNSTERYTRWSNSLTPSQLYTQAFTAFGPTLILPTWFGARSLFERVGLFSEDGKGTPEDMIFYYKHLALGGQLVRIDKPLLVYRYHQGCETFHIDRWTIWNLRVEAIQEFVLSKWTHFTIWNAGKQGRRLFRSLRAENRDKVVAFCDVDQKKINKSVYICEESKIIPKPTIPIIHFSAASPPFMLCVKWDLTDGGFEENLASLKLKEGTDYYHFS